MKKTVSLFLLMFMLGNSAWCQRITSVVDDFETLSGWSSGSNVLSLDEEKPKQGNYALKSEGNNILRFTKNLPVPLNTTVEEVDGYFCLSLFISDVTKLSGGGQIEISSGGKADFYESAWGFSTFNLKNGWNELILKLSTASKTPGVGGGETDLSAINFIRIYQGSSTSVIFKVDHMRFTNFYDNGHTVDPNFHLYLLAGQSNMSGRGEVRDKYKGTTSTYADVFNNRVKVLNADNEWVVARHPLHYDYPDVGVGPALDFAIKLLEEEDPDVTIGLIPTAVGGSNIDQWQPGQVLYNRAVPKTIIGSTDGVLKAVLFHQGEANVFDGTYSTWPQKLKKVISGFRSEFKNPELKFLIGELGHYNPEFENLNVLIPDIISTTPYTYQVSSSGLTDKGDHLHFNSASATELGIRYAESLRNAVLPVELLNFNLKNQINGCALSWTTAQEKNNNRFEIERSINGVLFERIGEIEGHQNSNTKNSYSFFDHLPVRGNSYYRLKQIDFDGKYHYSKVLNLDNAYLQLLKTQLYPVPFKESLKIESPVAGIIRMFDATGKLVFESQVTAGKLMQIETHLFAPGTYMIAFIDLKSKEIQRKQLLKI